MSGLIGRGRGQLIFIGALVLDWKIRCLIGTVVSWFCISLNLVDHFVQEWLFVDVLVG